MGHDPLVEHESDRYRDAQLVGAGGMGRVEAVHDTRLGREVARKHLHPALRDDPAAHARFLHEVQITARLDHPGIVPVFDAGRAADGTPWYTMRLVRGRSLEDVLTGLDLPQRLALVPRFLAACEAIAHAHAHGVIHRDLKPANVMLGPLGETQVVDWGLARELDERGEPTRGAVGTEGWMSPEQRAGERVDARADVWSLGQILRALLTGRCPPSDSLPDDAPPDLAAIADRATALTPDGRYADASALAEDVSAWLAGRRVSAFTYSTWDLFRRLLQAWRAPIAVALVATVALALAIAVAWRQTAAERDRAVLAESTMREVLRRDHVKAGVAALRLGDLGAAAIAASDALSLGDDPGARGLVAALDAVGPRVTLATDAPLRDCPRLALDVQGETLACATATTVSRLRVPEATPIWQVSAPALDVTNPSAEGPVWVSTELAVLALDPADGAVRQRVTQGVQRGLIRGTSHAAGTDHVRLWRPGAPDVGCDPPAMTYDAAERDGRWIIPCTDRALRVIDGAQVDVVQVSEPIRSLVTASWISEREALLGTLDGVVLRVDLRSGQVTGRVESPQGPIRRLALSPNGAWVAVAGERMPVRLLSLPGLVWVGGLPEVASDLAWRGSDTLVTAGARLRTWKVDGPTRWGVANATAGLDGAASDADGVTTLHDGSGDVAVIAPDGARVTTLHWQDGVVKQGDHHGGVFAAVAMLDVGVHRWDTRTWTALPTLGALPLRFVTFAAGGDLLALPWDGGVMRFTPDGRERRVAKGAVYSAIAMTARGQRWLAFGDPGGLALVDGDEVRWRRASTGLAAISGDGATVWLAEEDALLRLDATDGHTLDHLPLAESTTAIAATSDGQRVALGRLDGTIELRDLSGRVVAQLAGHQERVSELRFVDDTLLSASWDGTARRWALAAVDEPLGSILERLRARGAVDEARVGDP